jgi:hypothetical protein
MADILEKVVLSGVAVQRWVEVIGPEVRTLIQQGVALMDAPEEKAELMAGGGLEMYIELPDGRRVSVIIEPGEWEWVN